MKHIVITWQERLEDLYYIADATGSAHEVCEDEWWADWRPGKAGKFDDVEVEPIPKREYVKFMKYADGQND